MTDALHDLGWQPFFADQVTPDDTGFVPLRIASVHRTRLMAETGSGQVRLDLPLHGTTADYAVVWATQKLAPLSPKAARPAS